MKDTESKLSNIVMKTVFFSTVLLVVAGILYSFAVLFGAIIASVLLTFILEPVVNFFETKGIKRFWVIIGLYCVIILCAGAVLRYVVPILLHEAQAFSSNLPEYRAMLERSIETLEKKALQMLPVSTIPDLSAILNARLSAFGRMDTSTLMSYAANVFTVLSFVVLVPLITFFFLADGHMFNKALLKLVPNRYFEMFVLLIHNIISALKLFLRGQLIDAAAVGVMTSVGLALVGLPYFLVVGLIAGLGNLIPYLGPVIGFLPAVFVMLVTPGFFTPVNFILVVVVFVAVQFIEGTFIYPIAVGKSVDLHPLVVIVGISVGGHIGGILGMLVAIPIISIFKVTLEVLYANLKSYSII